MDCEKTVHFGTMEQPMASRQGPKQRISALIRPNLHSSWLTIINLLGLSNESDSSFPWCDMRSIHVFLACVSAMIASAASADSRVFIIANQADSYGIDQCLAKGERCGAHAARSYCQSRDFAQATSYRRVDPDEITGSVPKSATGVCGHAGCNEYVAITCQR